MNINQLNKINDYSWRLPRQANEQCGDVILYGSESLLTSMDDKVLEQIGNVAKLPGLVGPAMTMPDAHWGYGFPIGGVAAFDPEEGGIISAGGVGFDISCGVRCLRTNLTWDDMFPNRLDVANELYRTIPAGVGEGGNIRLSINELDNVLRQGATWAIKQGYGVEDDLLYIEEKGCMDGAIPENVSEHAKKRQLGEMGTLGSGNHYLELQMVETIYDEEAAQAFGIYPGQILVAIHCGSRGLGHQIGTDYLVALAKKASSFGISLPDRELACAPILTPEGQEYIGAMHAGINCALANRQILTHLARTVLTQLFPGIHVTTLYDVSHNTCKKETHVVNGKPRELYIHRKGATRAFGPGYRGLPQAYQHVGQPVLIGGSMGTASYILAGNTEEQNKAFASAAHGAGRAMSRKQALKRWRGTDLINELKAEGIFIRSRSMRGVAEEAPGAYKNVDEVAQSTEKADLARRVARLLPKICVKG